MFRVDLKNERAPNLQNNQDLWLKFFFFIHKTQYENMWKQHNNTFL